MKPEGRFWVPSLCTPFPLPFVVAPIVAAVTVVAAALVDFVVRIVVLFAVGLHRYRQHDRRRAVSSTHVHPQRKQRALLD